MRLIGIPLGFLRLGRKGKKYFGFFLLVLAPDWTGIDR